LWGCLIALVPVRLPGWAGLIGFAVLGALCVLPETPAEFTATSLASVVVVLACDWRFLRIRWLVRVGELSYGLYLWHILAGVLVLGGISTLGFPQIRNDPISIAGATALAFSFALASERWVERPFRRRRGRSLDHESFRRLVNEDDDTSVAAKPLLVPGPT